MRRWRRACATALGVASTLASLVIGLHIVWGHHDGPQMTTFRSASYALSYPASWKPAQTSAADTGPSRLPAAFLGPPDGAGLPTGEVVLRHGTAASTMSLADTVASFEVAAQATHSEWRELARSSPVVPGASSALLIDADFVTNGGTRFRVLDLFAVSSAGILYHLTAEGDVNSVTHDDLAAIADGLTVTS